MQLYDRSNLLPIEVGDVRIVLAGGAESEGREASLSTAEHLDEP
jgi:hypothetical protein